MTVVTYGVMDLPEPSGPAPPLAAETRKLSSDQYHNHLKSVLFN